MSTEILRANPDISASLQHFPVEIKTPLGFELPENFGRIESISLPKKTAGSLTVVHLKTAHGIYESSTGVADIIEFLTKKYRISQVDAEGSSAPLNPDFFRFFPEDEKNLQLADRLAKEGLATGVDLALAKSTFLPDSNQKAISVVGVESAGLYRQAYCKFKEVLNQTQALQKELDQQKLKLDKEASLVFDPEAREIVQEWLQFNTQKTNFTAMLTWIEKKSQKYFQLYFDRPLSQFEWPYLTRMTILVELRKRMDEKDLVKERERITRLLGEKKTEVFWGVLKAREAKSPRDFYEAFLRENWKSGFRFQNYPQISYQAAYQVLEKELDPQAFYEEIRKLYKNLFQKVLLRDNEKKLLIAYEKWFLLSKLSRLELTREEWEGLKSGTMFKDKKREWVRAALDFYRLAEKRERVFLRNIIRNAKKSGQKKVILVTGGFHAEGMRKLLEERGMGYVLIAPKLSQWEDSFYHRIMLEKAHLEQTPLQLSAISSLRQDWDIRRQSKTVRELFAGISRNFGLSEKKAAQLWETSPFYRDREPFLTHWDSARSPYENLQRAELRTIEGEKNLPAKSMDRRRFLRKGLSVIPVTALFPNAAKAQSASEEETDVSQDNVFFSQSASDRRTIEALSKSDIDPDPERPVGKLPPQEWIAIREQRIENLLDPALYQALTEKDPYKRASRIKALGLKADPKVVPILVYATNDSHWLVRMYAAWALGNFWHADKDLRDIQDPRFEALSRLAEDKGDEKSFYVRANAARALASLKTPSGATDPRAIRLLANLLSDPELYVVLAAVEAASRLQDYRLFENLLQLLEQNKQSLPTLHQNNFRDWAFMQSAFPVSVLWEKTAQALYRIRMANPNHDGLAAIIRKKEVQLRSTGNKQDAAYLSAVILPLMRMVEPFPKQGVSSLGAAFFSSLFLAGAGGFFGKLIKRRSQLSPESVQPAGSETPIQPSAAQEGNAAYLKKISQTFLKTATGFLFFTTLLYFFLAYSYGVFGSLTLLGPTLHLIFQLIAQITAGVVAGTAIFANWWTGAQPAGVHGNTTWDLKAAVASGGMLILISAVMLIEASAKIVFPSPLFVGTQILWIASGGFVLNLFWVFAAHSVLKTNESTAFFKKHILLSLFDYLAISAGILGARILNLPMIDAFLLFFLGFRFLGQGIRGVAKNLRTLHAAGPSPADQPRFSGKTLLTQFAAVGMVGFLSLWLLRTHWGEVTFVKSGPVNAPPVPGQQEEEKMPALQVQKKIPDLPADLAEHWADAEETKLITFNDKFRDEINALGPKLSGFQADITRAKLEIDKSETGILEDEGKKTDLTKQLESLRPKTRAALSEYERAQRLFGNGSMAKADFETRRSAYETLAGQENQLLANIRFTDLHIESFRGTIKLQQQLIQNLEGSMKAIDTERRQIMLKYANDPKMKFNFRMALYLYLAKAYPADAYESLIDSFDSQDKAYPEIWRNGNETQHASYRDTLNLLTYAIHVAALKNSEAGVPAQRLFKPLDDIWVTRREQGKIYPSDPYLQSMIEQIFGYQAKKFPFISAPANRQGKGRSELRAREKNQTVLDLEQLQDRVMPAAVHPMGSAISSTADTKGVFQDSAETVSEKTTLKKDHLISASHEESANKAADIPVLDYFFSKLPLFSEEPWTRKDTSHEMAPAREHYFEQMGRESVYAQDLPAHSLQPMEVKTQELPTLMPEPAKEIQAIDFPRSTVLDSTLVSPNQIVNIPEAREAAAPAREFSMQDVLKYLENFRENKDSAPRNLIKEFETLIQGFSAEQDNDAFTLTLSPADGNAQEELVKLMDQIGGILKSRYGINDLNEVQWTFTIFIYRGGAFTRTLGWNEVRDQIASGSIVFQDVFNSSAVTIVVSYKNQKLAGPITIQVPPADDDDDAVEEPGGSEDESSLSDADSGGAESDDSSGGFTDADITAGQGEEQTAEEEDAFSTGYPFGYDPKMAKAEAKLGEPNGMVELEPEKPPAGLEKPAALPAKILMPEDWKQSASAPASHAEAEDKTLKFSEAKKEESPSLQTPAWVRTWSWTPAAIVLVIALGYAALDHKKNFRNLFRSKAIIGISSFFALALWFWIPYAFLPKEHPLVRMVEFIYSDTSTQRAEQTTPELEKNRFLKQESNAVLAQYEWTALEGNQVNSFDLTREFLKNPGVVISFKQESKNVLSQFMVEVYGRQAGGKSERAVTIHGVRENGRWTLQVRDAEGNILQNHKFELMNNSLYYAGETALYLPKGELVQLLDKAGLQWISGFRASAVELPMRGTKKEAKNIAVTASVLGSDRYGIDNRLTLNFQLKMMRGMPGQDAKADAVPVLLEKTGGVAVSQEKLLPTVTPEPRPEKEGGRLKRDRDRTQRYKRQGIVNAKADDEQREVFALKTLAKVESKKEKKIKEKQRRQLELEKQLAEIQRNRQMLQHLENSEFMDRVVESLTPVVFPNPQQISAEVEALARLQASASYLDAVDVDKILNEAPEPPKPVAAPPVLIESKISSENKVSQPLEPEKPPVPPVISQVPAPQNEIKPAPAVSNQPAPVEKEKNNMLPIFVLTVGVAFLIATFILNPAAYLIAILGFTISGLISFLIMALRNQFKKDKKPQTPEPAKPEPLLTANTPTLPLEEPAASANPFTFSADSKELKMSLSGNKDRLILEFEESSLVRIFSPGGLAYRKIEIPRSAEGFEVPGRLRVKIEKDRLVIELTSADVFRKMDSEISAPKIFYESPALISELTPVLEQAKIRDDVEKYRRSTLEEADKLNQWIEENKARFEDLEFRKQVSARLRNFENQRWAFLDQLRDNLRTISPEKVERVEAVPGVSVLKAADKEINRKWEAISLSIKELFNAEKNNRSELRGIGHLQSVPLVRSELRKDNFNSAVSESFSALDVMLLPIRIRPIGDEAIAFMASLSFAAMGRLDWKEDMRLKFREYLKGIVESEVLGGNLLTRDALSSLKDASQDGSGLRSGKEELSKQKPIIMQFISKALKVTDKKILFSRLHALPSGSVLIEYAPQGETSIFAAEIRRMPKIIYIRKSFSGKLPLSVILRELQHARSLASLEGTSIQSGFLLNDLQDIDYVKPEDLQQLGLLMMLKDELLQSFSPVLRDGIKAAVFGRLLEYVKLDRQVEDLEGDVQKGYLENFGGIFSIQKLWVDFRIASHIAIQA